MARRLRSELDMNEAQWYAMMMAAYERMERLCMGPAPESIPVSVRDELNTAGTLFIDRLMSLACASAAFRYNCASEAEFKKAKGEITAEDVENAWLALHE